MPFCMICLQRGTYLYGHIVITEDNGSHQLCTGILLQYADIATPPEYAVVEKAANKSPRADVKANHDSNTDYDYAITAKPRVPARPTQSTGNLSLSTPASVTTFF